MSLAVFAAVFPLVFVAELPDKSMFASLLLASKGRPLAVWVGTSVAFAVHVVIAVSVGAVVLHALPHRAVEGLVAVVFAAGAVWALLARGDGNVREKAQPQSAAAAAATAGVVVFLAEWGDLTQIIIANLAATYDSWLSVGVGAVAALLLVAGLAVLGGSRLLTRVPVRYLRLATAVALAILAAYSAAEAV